MTEPNIVTTAAPPPRRDRTLLDTALLPWPISRTGVKSRSDRASARSLGRPTREHRQSAKPRVRPLAPSAAGVLLLQHLCTSPLARLLKLDNGMKLTMLGDAHGGRRTRIFASRR